MPRTSAPGRANRTSRVAEQIRRELSDIIRRELRDPRVGLVTLTDVLLSKDCAHATVLYSCLDAQHVKEADVGLRSATGFLRAQLARRIKLFTVPDLRFAHDESLERGARLSRLIEKAVAGQE